LEIVGTCVTSWDIARHDVDANYADGRSFILARDGGRMVIRDSELSYLGYSEDESYGVAWRLPGTNGEITNSKLGYNFYGLYLYRVSDIVITGNEVHHSVRYGIDPHTSSNRLRIENDRSHDNGKHGIILANGSNDSVIRNNEVFSNTLHGIVLYQNSNNNVVENNTVYNNGQEGIDVNDSSDNTIHNNIIHNNADAGIGIGQGARKNIIEGNQVYMNRNDGISLYSNAIENTILSNMVHGNNRYGLYIKSSNNTIGHNNEIYENQIGVYINANPAPDVSRTMNRIYQNRDADVRNGD
jgi:parallel beta-helix repeat protein